MTSTKPTDMSAGGLVPRFVDHVELVLPTRPELLFLARMTAAAVASRADFGYDQIEDLRLALDELCLNLLGGRPVTGRVQLQFSWNAGSIEIVAALEASEIHLSWTDEGALGVVPPPNDLSERILDALVDEHGSDLLEGQTCSWLRMHRRKDDD